MSVNRARAACVLISLSGVANLMDLAAAQQVIPEEAWHALESKDGAPPFGTTPVSGNIPRGPGSLSGTWFNIDVTSELLTGEAEAQLSERLPLQPSVALVIKQQRQDAKEGHPHANPRSLCLPNGIFPSLKKNGLKIIEEADVITILIENMNHFRQIFLNAAHSNVAPPSLLGDSVGHWEGDSLVVDTINFDTLAGVVGNVPQSDEMHVVERFRRMSKDKLEYIATIDDPKTFTKTWSMPTRTLLLRPEWHLTEYICTNQRNAPDAFGRTGVQLETK